MTLEAKVRDLFDILEGEDDGEPLVRLEAADTITAGKLKLVLHELQRYLEEEKAGPLPGGISNGD